MEIVWALRLVYSPILHHIWICKNYIVIPPIFIFLRGWALLMWMDLEAPKEVCVWGYPDKNLHLQCSFFQRSLEMKCFHRKAIWSYLKGSAQYVTVLKKQNCTLCFFCFLIMLLAVLCVFCPSSKMNETTKWELMSIELKNCQKCCSLCHFTLEVCFLHWKQVLLDWLT